MAKKKTGINDDELEFEPENNPRPLTEEELKRIALKKRIRELRENNRDNVQVIITKDGEAKLANTLTIEEQEEEYIKCAANPIYFIQTYLTVFDQTKGDGGEIVPFKLFPFQKMLIRHYLNNKQNIANKYRQAGVSTTTCAYIAWYVMFEKNRYVAVVADKLETARDELMSDIIDFIEFCPKYLTRPIQGKDTTHHKKYSNGSQMKAFAATKLRGPTPTLIFWDETAWTEKGDKFWTSAAASVKSTGGNVIFVSTPNGLDSVFWDSFDKALKKENDFNAIELYWYNDPRYGKGLYWIKDANTEKEIRLVDTGMTFQARKDMIKDGFVPRSPWYEDIKRGYNGNLRRLAQEVECSFLGSGGNFIAEEDVKRVEEQDTKNPISEEWEDKAFFVWEAPVPNAQYIMSIDVAAGTSEDFSTIIINKALELNEDIVIMKDGIPTKTKRLRNKLEQVAEYQGKCTPQQLAYIAYAFGTRYHDAYCVVDITGGLGLGTVEKLFELGYMNIHYSEIQHKPSRDRLSNWVKTVKKEVSPGVFAPVDMIPGFLIGSNRGLLLYELERGVRMGDLIIRSRRLTSEFKTLENKGGSRVAEHKRSYHDDLVFAEALGAYVFFFNYFKTKSNVEKTKAMLEAIMVVNSSNNMPDEQKHRQTDAPNDSPYGAYGWMFKNIRGS